MMSENGERIIMGIDPGTTIMGYAMLRIVNKQPSLLVMGIIDMRKIVNHYDRLQRIFERTLSLIDEFHPTELAIEAPFFGKNVQSMLKLGRGQGVAMAAALHRKIEITEYAPLKIKMAITGNGKASKEQVSDMLRRILKIEAADMQAKLDATDALGAALCHYYQTNRPQNEKKYHGWKDFVEKNKDKVAR
ncbi:MAG: crossover junction endodeoxyribonuclease RuvC [Bacteroidetes bacterium]|jgi:crossover junction endodeoxyribonuclease RuvC|nr:crossover junction endodeoxyribonuclease RuvC [Bacteroidota bacterium]